MTEAALRLEQALPDKLLVGQGQYQLIRGTIRGVRAPQLRLEVSVDGERDCAVELFPGERESEHDFVVSILWRPEDAGAHPELTLLLSDGSGSISRYPLGQMALLAQMDDSIADAPSMGDEPLVAICMATFNPDIDRLSRQLESILCQSYQNWLLIISDDASDALDVSALEALCRLDPRRIRLYRHDRNLGFYHNFERALTYLPNNAQLVALADQDDIWYPEKLQTLVDELSTDPGAMLVYSDMRIVDHHDGLIAGSYWQNRRNEYRDLASVLVTNTVTGAASLFRRELLQQALPFPPRVGDAYHDHWLACTALSLGRLRYFPRPLYDYVQYPDSVLGHQDQAVRALGGQLASNLRQAEKRRSRWRDVYRHDCLRLQIFAKTLKTRIAGRRGGTALRLVRGDWVSNMRLLWSFVKNRVRRRSNQAAELWLLMGFARGRGRRQDCRDSS